MNQLSETKLFQILLRFNASIAIILEHMNYWK